MENFLVVPDPVSAEPPALPESAAAVQPSDPVAPAEFSPATPDAGPPASTTAHVAPPSPSDADADEHCDLETMLADQAHLLHGIFTGAAGKYAQSRRDEHLRLHSAIALKAQNYCRMTVTNLAKIRNEKQLLAAKKQKPQNELLSATSTI